MWRCVDTRSVVKKTWGYAERSLDKRKKYLKTWYKHFTSGKTFVYVDESGFERTVTRQYGYSPIGKRVYGLRSGNKRPRTSLLAAKIPEHPLQATFLFQGTCNTLLFNAWAEHFLVPMLSSQHVVVMDNAIFHKSVKTRQLIENTGATLLFLPPYSPDLNPIEKSFANLKRHREFNEHLTIDQLIQCGN